MVDLTERLRTAAAEPIATGESVFEQIRADDIPFMAASIAYQAFVSLVPILVLLFLLVATVGDEAFATRVVARTEGFLPAAAQSFLRQAITGPVGLGSASASVVGFVTLAWGSLKIFRGLDKAFSEIYETGAENSILDQIWDALVVLVVLGLTVVAMVLAGSALAVFEGPLLQVLNVVVLVVGLTVAFLPIYKYFPDAELTWADAVPGAVFAAVGWTALQAVFQLYVAFTGRGEGAGAIGAVLLLLLWLYLGGLVLLVGGAVSAVLLGEGGPEPKTDEAPGDRRALARELHRERDRRQTLEHEVERLDRRLRQTESELTATELATVRRECRRLRRRLRWERKPLPVRLGLRLLGVSPPGATE